MRSLITLAFLLLAWMTFRAQCNFNCYNYSLSTAGYTTFPSGGTQVILSDDDLSQPVPIGFPFMFYCTNFTQVRICSNGFITFDLFSPITPSLTPYAQLLPTNSLPNYVIAYNWNDLDPSAGGSITYTTIGTTPNQRFIVSFSNVPLWNFGGSNTGQIVLYETSNLVEIHITSAVNNGWLTHTEGIEDGVPTVGVCPPGRNLALWTANYSSHQWSPYTITPPQGISGNTLLCSGDTATYAVFTDTSAIGYQWSLPPGWTGIGSASPVISTTAGASGNISVSVVYTCGISPPMLLQVTAGAGPAVNITSAAPGTVCEGESVIINGNGANTYTLLPVGLTSAPPYTVFPQTSTVYTLVGTGSSSCIAKGSTASITTLPKPLVMVNSGEICIGGSFTLTPNGAFNYTFSSQSSVITPTVPGIHQYSVTGEDTNNCVSDPAVSSLTVHAMANISVAAERTVICINEEVKLTASGGEYYFWSHTNTNGPTTVIKPKSQSIFTVGGVDAFGCEGRDSITIKVIACTGIVEKYEGNILQVFPNPSEGIYYFEADEGTQVEVLNAGGKKIYEATCSGIMQRVDICELPAGKYFMILWGGREYRTAILIKN